MKTSDHVTSNQIAAFSAGSLAASDSRTVGGHLIRCSECRSLLPIPDPARVWTAITSEHEFDEAPTTRRAPELERSFSQTVVGIFGRRNRLAWTGGTLAVIVGLTALFIFSVSNQQSVETEVARSFDHENPVPAPNQPNGMNSAVPGASGDESSLQKTNSNSKGRETPKDRRDLHSRTAATGTRTTGAVNRNISSTRGGTEPCSVGKTIDVELGTNKSDLILRWKRVPKAAKYHLYISDDNEVLIDEFETDRDTSYVLKKPLGSAKSYKWKIVITLESGQKLYTDAQDFTAKDFLSYLREQKAKGRSNTRCLTNE